MAPEFHEVGGTRAVLTMGFKAGKFSEWQHHHLWWLGLRPPIHTAREQSLWGDLMFDGARAVLAVLAIGGEGGSQGGSIIACPHFTHTFTASCGAPGPSIPMTYLHLYSRSLPSISTLYSHLHSFVPRTMSLNTNDLPAPIFPFPYLHLHTLFALSQLRVASRVPHDRLPV